VCQGARIISKNVGFRRSCGIYVVLIILRNALRRILSREIEYNKTPGSGGESKKKIKDMVRGWGEGFAVMENVAQVYTAFAF